MEDRFILFLKAYHSVFPITAREILLLKEVYRFFLLNYVVKNGGFFFNEFYADKLKTEAYARHFPSIDEFDGEKLIKALNL